MVTLGIGRTQTLVTHVRRFCWAIFALSGAGVVQNMAIFWGHNQATMGGWFTTKEFSLILT